MKTKDYLGKARLVAASDRANAFTGFAGSEIKNVSIVPSRFRIGTDIRQAGKLDVKDDRPPENLSFAATNLVKPGLSSKRQQSEPPIGRNMFPPTPPPEADKQAPQQMSRGASVRNGPKPMPAKLNIEKARPNERYEVRDEMMMEEPVPQRRGTARTASEPRGPASRQQYTPDRRPSNQQSRRRSEEEDDAYPDELYDMYSGSRNSRGSRRKQQQPRYIEEEDEDASDYDDGSFDENDFEMMRNPPRSRAPSTAGGRGSSRRPDIRKIRVKVHAEDVRYIMIGAAVEFPDLCDKIREKFGLKRRFKIKVRDEDMPNGDMITMGDQDDLEMVIMAVKSAAKRERLDMGKMEVSITFFLFT